MLICLLVGLLISPLIYFMYTKSIKLSPFVISDFNQNPEDVENFKILSWTESKYSSKYQVSVMDQDLNILQYSETVNTSIKLDDVYANNADKIIINVKSVDNSQNKKSSVNENYKVTWTIPTFDLKDGQTIYNNNEVTIDILNKNNLNLTAYYYALYKDNNLIYQNKVIDGKITIKKSIINKLVGTYKLILYKVSNEDEYIIDEKNVIIDTPKISDIIVNYPQDNEEIYWDDFQIDFSGGDNATKYYIYIRDSSNKVLFSKLTNSVSKIDVEISKLKEDTNYFLTIVAKNPLNKELTKISNTKFKTGKKNTVKSVESDTPNGNVTWNKKITLLSQTSDATIYYTLDGSEPTVNSTKYTEPIIIKSRITIKAIAVRKNMVDSEISEFKYTPIAYGMGSSNSWAPIALFDEGYLPIRYYNQKTGGYSYSTYGPENNDWDGGYTATIASHGCGPTAMSIVVSTLTEKDVNPAITTEYACNHGYCFRSGTLNSFIKDYAIKQGLNVEMAGPNDKEKIISALKTQKALVVVSVGPGTFTSTAHYIVLRGANDNGQVLVADPNSLERSKKFYDLDLIIEEAKAPYFFIISK